MKEELYFEHILIEDFFILLSVFLVYDVTKLREVYVAVLDIIVGQVNHLLLHGIQSKHFHGIN